MNFLTGQVKTSRYPRTREPGGGKRAIAVDGGGAGVGIVHAEDRDAVAVLDEIEGSADESVEV